MQTKRLHILLLSIICLIVIPFVQAAMITSCTFDKDTYHQGETGFITVTIYNDKESKIRITELTATIDYYYTDENVYLQSFFTNATLPTEISQGNSSTFHIPFSLPTNIASGYTELHVKAKTELWDGPSERWLYSDHPTHQPTLYIESPYKQESEDQLAANRNIASTMYLFGVTSIIFVAATVFLLINSFKL